MPRRKEESSRRVARTCLNCSHMEGIKGDTARCLEWALDENGLLRSARFERPAEPCKHWKLEEN